MILQFSGGLHHRAVAFFILHFQRYSIRESEHTQKAHHNICCGRKPWGEEHERHLEANRNECSSVLSAPVQSPIVEHAIKVKT